MIDFAHLESAPDLTPRFPMQAPDARKDWSEISRQSTFIKLMHQLAPRVLVYAIPNAGKRHPVTAKREGIMAGVFDMRIEWRSPLTAVIEFKGFGTRGTPGKLSEHQIAYGNRMHDLGHHAACFFCPYAAVDWLRDLGFPIAAMRVAA